MVVGSMDPSLTKANHDDHEEMAIITVRCNNNNNNNNNFDNNANESSRRRFSIELESDIEQQLELELERQPRIIGGSVVNNPGTRYPYFALMSGSARLSSEWYWKCGI
mmetsp:Transcript_21337/g.24645  ORF Transcript_21337/g.24645 Transcript_21337/m.24645 type:complete len:108 (-) Transcript_21337:709-1032(-)